MSTRAASQSPSLPAVGKYTPVWSEGSMPGGERRMEQKLGEGDEDLDVWGEGDVPQNHGLTFCPGVG